jgi:hypothetical protein
MGLMDAKEYDPRPARRLWTAAGVVVGLAIVGLILWFFPIIPFLYRFGSHERVINRFFEAIERKDFDAAYGIYHGDPDWKQHPERHQEYPLARFMLDWGPSGDYGPITSHRIDCAADPSKGGRSSSGVVVVTTINNRAEPVSLWVENKGKTITNSPVQVLCHPPR